MNTERLKFVLEQCQNLTDGLSVGGGISFDRFSMIRLGREIAILRVELESEQKEREYGRHHNDSD